MNEQRTEQIISRRDAMQRAIAAAAGLTVADRLSFSAPQAAVATSRPTSRSAKAKAVIQIWMWGGPSHLDTFDPKPKAGQNYCGPLNKPIAANVDGIQISELLPLLAKQADKYSIIRSMTHGSNAHEIGSYMVQTGRKPDRLVYPGVGAVVGMLKGYEHGYKGLVPPYVVLTEVQGRFSESGFLGQKYKPFATGGDPNQPVFAVEGIVAAGISDERQQKRRKLLGELDTLGKAMPGNSELAAFDKCQGGAYSMMFGDARKLFDLSAESKDVRDRYGRNTFGQSCLMARRLVEHGVPYVTINYKGWDTHKQNFETMRRKLPELDAGMSTLLQELSERGLLDSTIIWWGGEFGRTPRVQWEPPWNGGRGHFGQCFSAVVAGGGFKGGHVVGESNETGEEVAKRAVYPRDLIGSMYELLGIDPDGPLPNPQHLDVKLIPPADDSTKSEGRLKEIM